MSEKVGIKLNTKTWHYKLIKFVLRDAAPTPQNMHNLCPYFWLLVFSMLVSPLVGVGVLIWKIVGSTFYKFEEWVDELLIEPTAKSWFNGLEDLEVNQLWTDDKSIPRIVFKSSLGKNQHGYEVGRGDIVNMWFKKRFGESIYKTDDKGNEFTYDNTDKFKEWDNTWWKKRQDLANEAYEAREKRRQNVEKIQTNVQSWKNIIKWTKRVVGSIITLIGLTITYFVVNILGRGLLWCIENFNGPLIGNIFMYFGIVLVGMALIAGLIYVLRLWVIYVAQKGLTLWYAKAIYYPLFYLVYIPLKFVFADFIYTIILVNIYFGTIAGAKGIWNGLLGFTGIFGEYFGASYTDYCPGIDWEENEEK